VTEETLGQRIRRARLERGLTLAQVAGDDFSRAFLNQVEMGRSQPSTRVLRVIATRLGEPLDYLVEGSLLERELLVERGRLALARGRQRAALELVEPALADRSSLGCDARLCAAEALIGLGREAEARRLVEADQRLLRARGDSFRLRRLEALLSGGRMSLDPTGHEQLAERALREGRRELAVEHFRTARVLREAAQPASAPS
jgi:transcriptional regulator with XRE-family HTH domain